MWFSTPVPFQPSGRLILVSDGTVLAQDGFSARWWKLTPDAHGDYQHGSWTPGPPMVVPGSPMVGSELFTSPAPLLSGSFIVVGDEPIDRNGGPIEGPAQILGVGGGAWANEPVVGGWTAEAAVTCALPDGSVLAAGYLSYSHVIRSSDRHLWKWALGAWSVIADLPDGENMIGSLTLLPDGSVLTLGRTTAYRFLGDRWLVDGAHGLRATDRTDIGDYETGVVDGPVSLLPDGRVLAIDSQGGLALRATDGTWRAAGQLPDRYGLAPSMYGASACVLPNGRLLFPVDHPNIVGDGIEDRVTYYEWDPEFGSFMAVGGAAPDGTSSAGSVSPDVCGMLLLPNGWVLVTRRFDVVFYQPDPPSSPPAWAPQITAIGLMPLDNVVLAGGDALELFGNRLTGVGQGCFAPFGNANPTNYPLVRLEYPDATIYLTTRDHSTLAVAATEPEETTFVVPEQLPPGPANLCVVVNGVASCVPVTVQATPGSPAGVITRYHDFQKLIGSLADGQLWVLTPHGPVPQPSGPRNPAILAAYERILAGLEQLAGGAGDPLVARDAQRIPGLGSILSGLRSLRAAGDGARTRAPAGRKR